MSETSSLEERSIEQRSVEIRIFQEGEALTSAGHYLDSYRLEEGRWRFAERFFNSYHLSPWSTGWTK